MDPRVARARVPRPLRPRILGGHALAGVCLLRIRPLGFGGLPLPGLPEVETAAWRIAVEWEQDGRTRPGVFVPGRLAASRWMRWAGGRLFPGVLEPGEFRDGAGGPGVIDLTVGRPGRGTCLRLVGSPGGSSPAGSVFPTTAAASAFFREGAVGWSLDRRGRLEGLELVPDTWNFESLTVSRLEAALLGDPAGPGWGPVEFDSACLMERIHHAWRRVPVPPGFAGAGGGPPRRLTTFLELP